MQYIDLTAGIRKGLQFFDMTVSQKQLSLLNDYLNLLNKWNKAYNLTAIRNIHDMLDRHLIDSFSIASFLQGQDFIDVGTGPGLPGIPLAILFPDRQFHLLDSNGKKTRFLQQAKLELKLDNIMVHNQRVESLEADAQFDGVLSRAFTTLDDMLEKCQHLCRKGGYFYAMKGIYPEDELKHVKQDYEVHVLNWPGNDSERHLVTITAQ